MVQAQPSEQAALVTSADQQKNAVAAFFEHPQRVKAIKDAVPSVLRDTLTPERVTALALGVMRRTPALQKCSMPSIFNAMVQAASIGLELNTPLQHAYLVPYGEEATLIVGYRGLITLAHECGAIKGAWADKVTQNEVDQGRFEFERGSEPRLIHKPLIGDLSAAFAYYAVVVKPDGSKDFEVMSLGQIEAIRLRSRASKSGPWATDFDEQAKKTVYRRLLKRQAMSTQNPNTQRMANALDADDKSTGLIDIEGVGRDVPEGPPEPRLAKGADALADALKKKPESLDAKILRIGTSGSDDAKMILQGMRDTFGASFGSSDIAKQAALDAIELLDYIDADQLRICLGEAEKPDAIVAWIAKAIATNRLKPDEIQ